jgi:hypothetical protein
LNETGQNSITPATGSFEATGTFDIALENVGEATHAHLKLDDDLARIASIDANNHYVDGNSTRHVSVDVREIDEPMEGRLEITTGYGQQTEYITVRVVPPEVSNPPVEVDEALSEPAPVEESPDYEGLAIVPIAILAALAIGTAVVTALVLGDPMVWVGVLVVAIGVAVAVYLVAV